MSSILDFVWIRLSGLGDHPTKTKMVYQSNGHIKYKHTRAATVTLWAEAKLNQIIQTLTMLCHKDLKSKKKMQFREFLHQQSPKN